MYSTYQKKITKIMLYVCVDNSEDKFGKWKMLLQNSKLFWKYFKFLFSRSKGEDWEIIGNTGATVAV